MNIIISSRKYLWYTYIKTKIVAWLCIHYGYDLMIYKYSSHASALRISTLLWSHILEQNFDWIWVRMHCTKMITSFYLLFFHFFILFIFGKLTMYLFCLISSLKSWSYLFLWRGFWMILQSHNLSLSFRSISLLYPMVLFFIYLLYSPFSSSFHSLNFLLSHSSCSYTSFAFDKKILFEEGRKIKLYQLSCSQLIFDMLTNIIHDMKRGHSFLAVVTIYHYA